MILPLTFLSACIAAMTWRPCYTCSTRLSTLCVVSSGPRKRWQARLCGFAARPLSLSDLSCLPPLPAPGTPHDADAGPESEALPGTSPAFEASSQHSHPLTKKLPWSKLRRWLQLRLRLHHLRPVQPPQQCGAYCSRISAMSVRPVASTCVPPVELRQSSSSASACAALFS